MKIPKLRPTYGMLLQHAWLAPLALPPTITEEDEEAAERAAEAGEELPEAKALPDGASGMMPVGDQQPADKEVADWVIGALDRKRNGLMARKAKPALHAAPLDAVSTPGKPEVAV